MVIYLRHPKHGTKVAISDMEAKADERNGWERFVLGAEPEAPSNEMAKRRGRPPLNRDQQ
jgi:hypothetical protein